MRVVFMGTPLFASCILGRLFASRHQVVGVFTRPDAIRGRGKRPCASQVKLTAQRSSVPVFEYTSLRGEGAYRDLTSLEPEVVCVAAFGALLPKRVLELAPYGCLNVHASLLPRWRGAAPIERAILAGDEKTGISIMRMEEDLDTGPVCAMRSVEIGTTSAEELTTLLAQLGGDALVDVLDLLDVEGSLSWTPQSSQATYASKIEKGELDLSPSLSVSHALRRVQAAGQQHTSRCVIAGRGITIQAVARPATGAVSPDPGSVLLQAKHLYLGFSDGALEVLQLKPDGKRSMDAQAFAAGIRDIKQGRVRWQGSEHE